jgi:hypothetical protein
MSKARTTATFVKAMVFAALILALLPVQSALAGAKTNPDYGITLRFPNNSVHCTKLAKFYSIDNPADWTVTYSFYTATQSGLGELIYTATVSGEEFVVTPYPGGFGQGMYAVVAQYFDANGAPMFKLAGKWTMECEKAPTLK